MYKRILLGATVAALIVLPWMRATSPAWSAEKPMIMPILSAPLGAGPYVGHTIFANQLAKGGEKLMVAAQETPGYMSNVRLMAQKKYWKTTAFSTEDTIIQLAIRGGSTELKEFLPDPIPIKFKLLYGEAYWTQGKFFVTTDPSIKSVADLKGKRISLGLRGQSDWGVYPRLFLEHAYGITPDNSDIRHMSPGALTQQLIDGVTDVGLGGFGTQPTDLNSGLISPTLRKLEAAGRKVTYIGIDQSAIDKVNKKFGTTFFGITLKAGTLPAQDKDIFVGVNRGYKAVHPDFSEELAYQFVKLSFKYQSAMKDLNALWKILTPEMMVDGLTEANTHPGAIRALKEIGIWDSEARKKSVPVTYPES